MPRVLRRKSGSLIALVACAAVVAMGQPLRAQKPAIAAAPVPDMAFVRSHCVDCHQGAEAEAGLDFTRLGTDLANGAVYRRWVRVFDRIQDGEMPPPDVATLSPSETAPFLQNVGEWLRQSQQQQDAEFGRVRGRQLTRREVERSLHDLLGIDIPLTDQLPEDSTAAEFSTVADGQSISHFQLERHLAGVDVALDEAFRRALSADDVYERDFDPYDIARRGNRRTREPEIIRGQAVTWSSGLIFYGRIPATTAPESGWYRFTVRANGLKLPESGGVWTTVRTGLCVSSAPLLGWVGSFEATARPREFVFEAWLPRRHMLEIRPGDSTIRKARFEGGQVGNGEGEPQNVPGIAIDRITMTRFHRGPDNAGVRKLVLGGVDVKWDSKSKRFRPAPSDARRDVERLLVDFASRAFRRPVSREEVEGYVRLALESLAAQQDFVAALRIGYRAILCSPRFLYLNESPGDLDDYAIAARLSYLLTGSTPDAELRQLADAGQLRDQATIEKQAERLLRGAGGRRFVEDFAAEWLDLDQIDFTQPDSRMFPDFDPIVQHAMLDETHAFLETMLRENRSVTELIHSDYTYLNSRLARYYEIEGVTGDELRRVALRADDRRGGVLAHGSILKVTANGSTTSPVVRGVWISERLLGQEIPPPPDSVPAIEPDIRGATSIREMLAKHRSQAACASCHVKIDPAGFALENFDPAGRWRDWYGRAGRSAKVDPSYALPDGRRFDNLNEFRELIVAEPRKLARNVVEKLIVYGTGAPVSFADRECVEACVDRVADEHYGFRSIVAAVATSSVFLSK